MSFYSRCRLLLRRDIVDSIPSRDKDFPLLLGAAGGMGEGGAHFLKVM
jgi:hypothetical protein